MRWRFTTFLVSGFLSLFLCLALGLTSSALAQDQGGPPQYNGDQGQPPYDLGQEPPDQGQPPYDQGQQPPYTGQGPQDQGQGQEPQGGVGRISVLDGNVSTQRGDSGDWVADTINTP